MARQINHPHLCVLGQRPEQIPPCVARRASAMDEQDLGPLVTRLLYMPAHTTGRYQLAAVRVWPMVAMRLPVHGEGLAGQLRPKGLAVTGSGLHHLCHALAVGLGQGYIASAHGQRDLFGLRFGSG